MDRYLTRFGFRFGVGGLLALFALRLQFVPMPIAIGVLLVGAGLGFVALAFEAQTGGKGMLPLLLGLVALVTGVCFLIWPSMKPLTSIALLATYSSLSGGLTVTFALQLRPLGGWRWVLVGGIVSMLAAAAIWFQFPISGPAAESLLLALNLLTAGVWLVALRGVGPSRSTRPANDTDMSI